MSDLSELGAILTGTRAVGKPQWESALEIAEAAGGDLDGLLAAINALAAQPPHWWDGKQPQPPGLTEHQQTVIRSRFVDDELPFLRRDLALNQFLLLNKLGQGGQGEVYRARQLNPPRFAAIKTLVRETDVRRRRFEQEARSMMKIQHPAVARFYLYERVRDASGEPTDEYLIAMEFVHGTPLHRHVHRSGLVPWPFAIHWTIQLLGGLAAIHTSGLVHGDVKPENVMVIGPPRGPDVKVEATGAKLLDFGAARVHGDESDEPRRTFVGTPEYAPPEQWTGEEVPASDLYSLGGTLYYMLTARFPYQKERREPFAYRDSHTNDALLEVREHNANVPPELSEILKKMLAKSPADRGTPEELIAMLKALQPKESPTPPPADRPRTKPKPQTKTVPALRTPAQKPPETDDRRNPLYKFADNALANLEKMFIPGFFRPLPGQEAAIPERILALLRRPLLLVLTVLFAALVLYGLYSLR